MEEISIPSIIVENRFRQDMGDIAGLAQSIEQLGLLQPIILNKDRRLIAGGRRLEAFMHLGRSTIPARIFDVSAIEALRIEDDENEQRKQPTTSERVALGQAIERELAARHGKNQHTKEEWEKFPTPQGRTTDLVAKQLGFGSGKTYEAAAAVVSKGVPQLVEAMDQGHVSIHAAKHIAALPTQEQEAVNFDDKEDVRRASKRALQRTARASVPKEEAAPVKPQEKKPPKPDHSRLVDEGSSLSAWSLAIRASEAIKQILIVDKNAIPALDHIQRELSKHYEIIQKGQQK